jgi:hypothetical protein
VYFAYARDIRSKENASFPQNWAQDMLSYDECRALQSLRVDVRFCLNPQSLTARRDGTAKLIEMT